MSLQGTPNDWRKDMLEILSHLKSQDVVTVTWQSSNDNHVCPLCAARNRKIYTIDEAKKELKGKFCQPGDPDDRCRCSFTTVEYKKSSPKPKRRRRKSKKNAEVSGTVALITLGAAFFIFWWLVF